MQFSKKKIEELQRSGKIRGFKTASRGTIPCREGKKGAGNKQPRQAKRSREKAYIELNLQYWCNEKGVTLSREYQFDKHDRRLGGPVRKFRFDWAIESLKIAIEYEGLNSDKSVHTTMDGYTSNTDKYNRATALGWRVIRFTLKNYETVTTVLNNVYDHGNSGPALY